MRGGINGQSVRVKMDPSAVPVPADPPLSASSTRFNRPLSAQLNIQYSPSQQQQQQQQHVLPYQDEENDDQLLYFNPPASAVSPAGSRTPRRASTTLVIQECLPLNKAGCNRTDVSSSSSSSSRSSYTEPNYNYEDVAENGVRGTSMLDTSIVPFGNSRENDLHQCTNRRRFSESQICYCCNAAPASTLNKVRSSMNPVSAAGLHHNGLDLSCSTISTYTTETSLNTDCNCSRHHHRRNSIAIKFDKPTYFRS